MKLPDSNQGLRPALWIGLIALGAIAATTFVYLVPLHGKRTITSLDAAAMVVLIGAVSVGIERTIEALWSIVSMWKGSVWPLGAIASYVGSLTDSLDTAVKPFYEQAHVQVALAERVGAITSEVAASLKADIDSVQADIQRLQTNAKESQQLETYAAAAANVVNTFQIRFSAAYALSSDDLATVRAAAENLARSQADAAWRRLPEAERTDARKTALENDAVAALAKDRNGADLPDDAARLTAYQLYVERNQPGATMVEAAKLAGTTLAGVSDYIATFKDNPGKRLLSIELGVIVGIAVAAIVGLDAFAAVAASSDAATVGAQAVAAASLVVAAGAATPAADATSASAPVVVTAAGVIVTGFVLGLGANPTHELVRSLQEYKKRAKLESAPTGGDANELAETGLRGLTVPPRSNTDAHFVRFR